nr:hypothetical protein [Kitasatospora purpeofusca]
MAPTTYARLRLAAETASTGPVRQRVTPHPSSPAASTPPTGTAAHRSGESATPSATVAVAAAFSRTDTAARATVRSAIRRRRETGRVISSSMVPDSTSAATAAAPSEPMAVSWSAIQKGWVSPAPSSPA